MNHCELEASALQLRASFLALLCHVEALLLFHVSAVTRLQSLSRSSSPHAYSVVCEAD